MTGGEVLLTFDGEVLDAGSEWRVRWWRETSGPVPPGAVGALILCELDEFDTMGGDSAAVLRWVLAARARGGRRRPEVRGLPPTDQGTGSES